MDTNDIMKRAHNINHSHGGCVMVSLDKINNVSSIWNVHRNVLFFTLHEGMNMETEEGAQQKNSGILVYDTIIDTEEVKKKSNKTITTEIEEL